MTLRFIINFKQHVNDTDVVAAISVGLKTFKRSEHRRIRYYLRPFGSSSGSPGFSSLLCRTFNVLAPFRNFHFYWMSFIPVRRSCETQAFGGQSSKFSRLVAIFQGYLILIISSVRGQHLIMTPQSGFARFVFIISTLFFFFSDLQTESFRPIPDSPSVSVSILQHGQKLRSECLIIACHYLMMILSELSKKLSPSSELSDADVLTEIRCRFRPTAVTDHGQSIFVRYPSIRPVCVIDSDVTQE